MRALHHLHGVKAANKLRHGEPSMPPSAALPYEEHLVIASLRSNLRTKVQAQKRSTANQHWTAPLRLDAGTLMTEVASSRTPAKKGCSSAITAGRDTRSQQRDCPRESASRDCPFLGGLKRNPRFFLRRAAKQGQTRLPRGLVRLGQSRFCSLLRMPARPFGGNSRTAPLRNKQFWYQLSIDCDVECLSWIAKRGQSTRSGTRLVQSPFCSGKFDMPDVS